MYQRQHQKAAVKTYHSYLIAMQSLIRRLDLAKGIQCAGTKRPALCEIAFLGTGSCLSMELVTL